MSVNSMALASEGWSDVGQGLATGLSQRFDRTMQQTTEGMTTAIAALTVVEKRLGAVQKGVEAVQAWPQNSSTESFRLPWGSRSGTHGQGHAGNASGLELANATKRLAKEAAKDLTRFHGIIKAVLLQVKEWLIMFGDKMQATIEGFSAGIDVVQFLLDQIMAQLRSGGGNELHMRFESFTLFDLSGTHRVSLADIQNVSRLYSIPALQGRKAEELFAKYDADNSGKLTWKEFGLFVHDEAIPGAMAVVLRSFARHLSGVAGLLSSARMRDEIAFATMEYLRLVCAKNMTKVSWIADALSNRSLPIAFAGDVLAQLALAAEHPGKSLTALSVGEVLVDKMVELSPETVAEVMALLTNASAWAASGFAEETQGPVAKRVARWAAKANKAHHVAPLLFDSFGLPRPNISHARPWMRQGAESFQGKHTWKDGAAEADDEGALLQLGRTPVGAAWQAEESGRLSAVVSSSGGISVEEGEEEEEAAMLQRSSKQAAMRRAAKSDAEEEGREALARAQWRAPLEALPSIAELCAERGRRRHAWRRRRESSEAALPVLASPGAALRQLEGGLEGDPPGQINPDAARVISSGVLAQPETLQFAQWLANNASHTADRLQNQCFDYTMQSSEATQRVASQVTKMTKRFQSFLSMLERYATPKAIDRLDHFMTHFAGRLEHDLVAGLEYAQSGEGNASFPHLGKAMEGISRVWHKADPILSKLVSVLPICIDDLKLARRAVSTTSAQLKSTFVSLKGKAPPIFAGVSKAYKSVCILYFAVFFLLTAALMLYTLWASGYLDKSEEQNAEGYEPPRTFLSRLRTCASSCGRCLEACDDRQVVFWSAMLLMQLLWLVMFVASQGVLMVMGVRAFVAAGCKPVYILGDESLCSEAMTIISTWLGSADWIEGTPLGEACGRKDLLVCKILDVRLGGAMRLAALGNTIAAFVTFQLIVETAVMHERHRCRALLEAAKRE